METGFSCDPPVGFVEDGEDVITLVSPPEEVVVEVGCKADVVRTLGVFLKVASEQTADGALDTDGWVRGLAREVEEEVRGFW